MFRKSKCIKDYSRTETVTSQHGNHFCSYQMNLDIQCVLSVLTFSVFPGLTASIETCACQPAQEKESHCKRVRTTVQSLPSSGVPSIIKHVPTQRVDTSLNMHHAKEYRRTDCLATIAKVILPVGYKGSINS